MMCIIVIQPEGYKMTTEQILDFVDRNPHGFGFMWIDEHGKLCSFKAVYDPDYPEDAVEDYYRIAAQKAGVLHYRFATSGPVNEAMAHPFRISDDLLMMHNGVLEGGNSSESDTAQFVREVVKPLLADDYTKLYDRHVRDLLTDLVRGSVLVFLDRDGVVTVLGNTGVEWDECWYSNTYAWTLPPQLGGPGLYADDFEFDEDSGEFLAWSDDPEDVTEFLLEEERRDRRRR